MITRYTIIYIVIFILFRPKVNIGTVWKHILCRNINVIVIGVSQPKCQNLLPCQMPHAPQVGWQPSMIMWSHGSPCCITDPLCGESAGQADSPHKGSVMHSYWCLPCCALKQWTDLQKIDQMVNLDVWPLIQHDNGVMGWQPTLSGWLTGGKGYFPRPRAGRHGSVILSDTECTRVRWAHEWEGPL